MVYDDGCCKARSRLGSSTVKELFVSRVTNMFLTEPCDFYLRTRLTGAP